MSRGLDIVRLFIFLEGFNTFRGGLISFLLGVTPLFLLLFAMCRHNLWCWVLLFTNFVPIYWLSPFRCRFDLWLDFGQIGLPFRIDKAGTIDFSGW